MRRIIATLLAIFLTVPAEPAFAYLKFGTRVNGRQVTLKWMQTPVRYFVSSRNAVPGVSVDDFQPPSGAPLRNGKPCRPPRSPISSPD
jgi:hypothetical protein